jgi:hypothetical protein
MVLTSVAGPDKFPIGDEPVKSENLSAIALAAFVLIPYQAGANIIERTGYAYGLGADDPALLYTEQHEEWVENGRITRSTVTYKDADGNVIAKKDLDFSKDPTSPEFRLNGIANGHVEGATRTKGEVVVFFRKSDDHELMEKAVNLPEEAIIDGGFDRFIENNWDALLEGKVFNRPFLVPSFRKFVDFKIYLERTTETDAVFVMETASLLLRLLSEKIEVTYSREDAALKRYVGISNIRDRQGENYEVRVEFPGAARNQ